MKLIEQLLQQGYKPEQAAQLVAAFHPRVFVEKTTPTCQNEFSCSPLTDCVRAGDDEFWDEDDLAAEETWEEGCQFLDTLEHCGFTYDTTLTLGQLLDVVEAYEATLPVSEKKAPTGMKWVFGKLLKLGKRIKTKGKNLLKRAVKGVKAKWHAKQAKKYHAKASAAAAAATRAQDKGNDQAMRTHARRAKHFVKKGHSHAKKAGLRQNTSKTPPPESPKAPPPEPPKSAVSNPKKKRARPKLTQTTVQH